MQGTPDGRSFAPSGPCRLTLPGPLIFCLFPEPFPCASPASDLSAGPGDLREPRVGEALWVQPGPVGRCLCAQRSHREQTRQTVFPE